MNNLLVISRVVKSVENRSRSEREDAANAAIAIRHNIPVIIKVFHATLAMHVENVLIVIDVAIIRGKLKPLLHRM